VSADIVWKTFLVFDYKEMKICLNRSAVTEYTH